MEVAETHANRRISRESPRRGQHLNARRLERVLLGEGESAVVKATFIWAIGQAEDAEMPVKDVVRGGLGDEIFKVFTLLNCDKLHLESLRTH